MLQEAFLRRDMVKDEVDRRMEVEGTSNLVETNKQDQGSMADAPLIPVQGYNRRSQHDPYAEGYNERQHCELQLRYPTPGNAKA